MTEKSSYLNLYNSENLNEKTFYLKCANDGVKIDIQNQLQFNVDNLSLTHTDAKYNIDNLANTLYNRNAYVDNHISRIDTNISTNTNLINTETVNRISDLNTVNSKITNEIQRATTVENELRTEIASNLTSVKQELENEINLRYNNDVANRNYTTTQLNAEKTARQAHFQNLDNRIDTLLYGTGINTDTLIEIVNAYKNADTDILSTISTLTNRITYLENKINTALV